MQYFIAFKTILQMNNFFFGDFLFAGMLTINLLMQPNVRYVRKYKSLFFFQALIIISFGSRSTPHSCVSVD